MNNTIISSPQNPLIKRIRSLKTRKGRAKERAFWVEGLAPAIEAVDAGWDVQTLIRSPELLKSEKALRFLESVNVEERILSSDLFSKISDRDGPAGLGAIVSARDLVLADLEVHPDTLVVVLIEPQDPGNLGTIIRTAYCAGVSALVLVGNATDPFDPRAVRASMGALFRIPVVREASAESFVRWAAENGIHLTGTSARATESYRSADYALPRGIVMGNEQKGIPDAVADACAELVSIPMSGTVNSLNLSAAAAIIIYEAAIQAGRHNA